MMTVAASTDFVSLGQLAADLQQSPRRIEAACEALQIAPAMRLNRVVHFNAEQAEKLTEHFRENVKR